MPSTQLETPLRPATATSGLNAAVSRLFEWRQRPSFGPPEALVLTVYFAVVALTIPFHERSIDEAQAWLIARDSSIHQIFRYRLHYEGAPALWHICLRLFHDLHGTYAGINWLGAAFATAGIFVFLRWSPFPLILRLLIPFTFFLQYQYAVVARGYTLFPLLVFTLLALYHRKDKLLWFAIVAGLLANLSFQGVIVGGLLTLLYLFDLYREDRRLRLTPRYVPTAQRPAPLRRLAPAAAIYAASLLLAVYTAMPAPDISFPAATGQAPSGRMHDLLVKHIGVSPWIPHDKPYVIFLHEPFLNRPSPIRHPALWAAWKVNHRDVLYPDLDHLPPGVTPADVGPYFSAQTTSSAALEFFLGVLSQCTWPIATYNIVAVALLIVLILWLRKRHALRTLIPWLILILSGQILWVADHHAGMIFVAILAAIWLATLVSGSRPAPRSLDRLLVASFAVILALQIHWSAVAINKDVHSSYDPGPETAAWLHSFIATHPEARIAAYRFHTVSIEPYFRTSPFFNVPHSYWLWSWFNDPEAQFRTVLATRPDMIVYARETKGPGEMRNQWAPISHIYNAEEQHDMPYEYIPIKLKEAGYQETHRFCGSRFSRTSTSYVACDVIFQLTTLSQKRVGQAEVPANPR